MSAVADQIKTNLNGNSIDLNEPTKEHIRSMDISIKRLVEENNQANKQLVSELRSEIKLLAKTISAAVEKNKK